MSRSLPFRVQMIFEFSEGERRLIANYLRRVRLEKGVPRLARRRDLRMFVRSAVNNQWLLMEDDLAQLDEDERKARDAKATGDDHTLSV